MYKEILKNIIPSMFATLFTGFYVIVDGFFIGQKVGGIGLAAINIAWPIAAFIQALGLALGMASGIYISYYRAKNKDDKTSKVLTNTLVMLLIFTLIVLSVYFYRDYLLTLIGANEETLEMASNYIKVYILGGIIEIIGCAIIPILRNFGHYKSAALLLLIATAINFLGDYILIFLLDYGLVGAALASVLGQLSVLIVGIIILIKYKHLKFAKKIDKNLILGLFLKGIAPFILTFSASFLIIIYNLFCLKYGGNDAVAAYTVVAYIIYVAQYISIGISDGIQPVLTYHYSLNDGKVKSYFYKTLIILIGILATLNIIFIFMDNTMADLYNIYDNARNIYLSSYYYFIFTFIPLGLIRIYAARFYSTDKNIKADIIVLLEPLLTPFVLLIFTSFMGLNGIWLSYLLIEIILGISSIIITKIPIKEIKISEISVEE